MDHSTMEEKPFICKYGRVYITLKFIAYFDSDSFHSSQLISGTTELTKKLCQMKFDYDWLFKKRKQPWA